VPMKDVLSCDKLRKAAEERYIRRCPNGETRPRVILGHLLLKYASAKIDNSKVIQWTETT